MDTKLRSQLDQFHSIEDFKVLYPPVSFTVGDLPPLISACVRRKWLEAARDPGTRAPAPATEWGWAATGAGGPARGTRGGRGAPAVWEEAAGGAAGTTAGESPNLTGAATVMRATAGSSAPATRSVLFSSSFSYSPQLIITIARKRSDWDRPPPRLAGKTQVDQEREQTVPVTRRWSPSPRWTSLRSSSDRAAW